VKKAVFHKRKWDFLPLTGTWWENFEIILNFDKFPA
jgi:hypothetical protein